MYKATVYKCVKKEKGVMESVGRKRKCLSRKNHQKPVQSTKFLRPNSQGFLVDEF